MNNQIGTTEQFFNACKGKSIAYKLKAIENLNVGLLNKGAGLWSEEHCKAIRELIQRLQASTVIEL